MTQRILDLLTDEIDLHSEHKEPWYWRWICKLFRRRECHEVVIKELRFFKKHLEDRHVRNCADCGKTFEPVNSFDWWCKECLLKRFNDLRSFGIDYAKILMDLRNEEPPLTNSGPGGS